MRRYVWTKDDPSGVEQWELTMGSGGLVAGSVAIGLAPVPYRVDLELTTGADWVTQRLSLRARCDRWTRMLVLERNAAGIWVGSRSTDGSGPPYALFMLRVAGPAPGDFLTDSGVDVGDARLPTAGPEHRLRWDLSEVHAALSDARRLRRLTWAKLAAKLDCTPSRLTGLRTATFADMELAMRVTHWLAQPAAAFIHPAQW